MNRKKLLITFIAIILGGIFIAVSGLIPIKASAGHWPITKWFLNFVKNRSVSTQSAGIKSPPLEDAGLILKGANHYELNCAVCHGTPAKLPSRTFNRMLPPPPQFPSQLKGRDPEDLFYIVKHGIKFTGMPAWPTQKRDDEIWSVVAFLLKLPDIDKDQYQQLVRDESSQSKRLSPTLQMCAQCHGSDGMGRGENMFPILAGQQAAYLQNALRAYAEAERASGIMEPIASKLEDQIIEEVSHYFSKLQAQLLKHPSQRTQDLKTIARGKEIAHNGIENMRVASCIDCHGPKGQQIKDAYPILNGQPSEYLYQQLLLFKDNQRGGSAFSHLMHPVVERLSPHQMKDVVVYFESLGGH